MDEYYLYCIELQPMKNYLSSLGLGAVTIVSVMGLLSLTAGLTASTDATRSIVFTTQQVRSVV